MSSHSQIRPKKVPGLFSEGDNKPGTFSDGAPFRLSPEGDNKPGTFSASCVRPLSNGGPSSAVGRKLAVAWIELK